MTADRPPPRRGGIPLQCPPGGPAGPHPSTRQTDTADIGTNFPTHEKEGSTVTSELGFTIRTLADHDEVRTSDQDTIVKSYRVPSRSKVPAECPMKTGPTPAPQPHYPEASLLK